MINISPQLTRTVLIEEGVVANKRKKKHLFGKTELIQFNTTFWTVDDTTFVHPRNKVQIPFIISVFCWTGARIGAFFPDSGNKDDGGLRYRVGPGRTVAKKLSLISHRISKLY